MYCISVMLLNYVRALGLADGSYSFLLRPRNRKKYRHLFLIILPAVLRTLLQEKAGLLYFCEFPHNAFFSFGMQN